MSSNNFVFPPPPPPPPQTGPQSYPSTQPFAHQSYGSQGSGTRGYGNRGRGGNVFRGSRGASNYNTQNIRGNDYSTANNGYSNHMNGYTSASYPLPEYPLTLQPPQPVQPAHNGYTNGYGTSQPYPESFYGNQYDQYAMANGPTAYNTRYINQHIHQPNVPQPIAMGPPIRMGFDMQSANNQAFAQERLAPSHAQSSHDPRTFQHKSPNSSNVYRGRGQKRIHSEAFSHSRGSKHRISALPTPPAVPSFGNPLPVKPPAPEDAVKKPRKKKRKHNQLGLTPKTEEHESSEEDEEIDEEAKLAAVQGLSSQGPQQGFEFSYNGRVATLNSPSEIEAWIAERKKRYPTKARMEEKRKRKEEEHSRNRESLDKEAKAKLKAEKLRKKYEKAQRQVTKMEAKKVKSGQAEHANDELNLVGHVGKDETHRQEIANTDEDVKPETKIKTENDEGHTRSPAEVNPHFLDTSLGTIVAADAKEVDKLSLDSAENATLLDSETCTSINNTSDTHFSGPNPLTPTSQPTSPNTSSSLHQAKSPPPTSTTDSIPEVLPSNSSKLLPDSQNVEKETDSVQSLSDTSSDLSSSDECEDSSSDESSSSNDAPTEATSKRNGHTKIEPSRAMKKAAVCNAFLAKGRCKMGDQCRYLHELPKRGTASREQANRATGKVSTEGGRRGERMTLYQRMVAQEQEKEDQMLLQDIIFLGEHGALDEPMAKGKSKVPSEADVGVQEE